MLVSCLACSSTQKTAPFIVTTVRTSNPTQFFLITNSEMKKDGKEYLLDLGLRNSDYKDKSRL
jgi:hypothetical protein